MAATTTAGVEIVAESVIESIAVVEGDVIAQDQTAEEEMDDLEKSNGNQDKAASDFLGNEGSDSEDDFVVTIGEIKEAVPYKQKQAAAAAAAAGGNKVELDANPLIKGTQIYDLDLATMEDKPWRKPGADITDYFNYGFNEDTWNQYCERQRKLRVEYGGNQEAVNKAIFNAISLPSMTQLSTLAGGRQLVSITGGGGMADHKPIPKVNKMVIDLSKPPPAMESNPVSIIRTVITGSGSMTQNVPSSLAAETPQNTSNSSQINFKDYPVINIASNSPTTPSPIASLSAASNPIPTLSHSSVPSSIVGSGQSDWSTNSKQQPSSPVLSGSGSVPDFSRPPPSQSNFSKPPPAFEGISLGINQGLVATGSLPLPTISSRADAPPGLDDADLPPGASTPPPGLSSSHMSMSSINTSVPPPASFGGFNPNVPPPGVSQTRIGMPSMNVPPPSVYNQYSHSNSGSAGFGGGSGQSMGGYSRQPLIRGSGGFNTQPPGTESMRHRMSGGPADYIKREELSSGDSGDESYRRKRRRRSKSPIVSSSRRSRGDESSSYRESSRRHESSGLKRKSDREREKEKERSSDKKRSSTRDDRDSEEKDRKRKKHEKGDKDK